ncbi:SCO6880 family protein [Microlunatus sp. Y2014]|uniref:SCO6880 family protein n=1 Tax=Microlunatus sp. Y2014 TaxID=3418488 RepID=UPI003DA758A3
MSDLEGQLRLYQLGGGATGEGLLSRARVTRLAPLVVVMTGGVIAMLVTQSPVVLVVSLVATAAVAVVTLRRSGSGEPMIVAWGHAMRRRLARALRWDSYDPVREESPIPLGPARWMGVAPSEAEAKLAVIEHREEKYFSAVIEIEGGGAGIREHYEQNLASARIGNFLASVAQQTLPVDQIDMATHTRPAESGPYLEWMQQRLRPDIDTNLRESMVDLAATVADSAEQHTSWMVVRMPTAALADRITRDYASAPTTEALAEMAYATTEQVAGLARSAGLTVRRGLSPRRLGALIRGILMPSQSPTDLTGIGSSADGLVPYSTDTERGISMVTVDEESDVSWYHSVGTIPVDGWPSWQITGRWLAPLVLGCPVSYRTVVTQWQLVPRAQAAPMARAAATFDRSQTLSKAKRGVVTGGQEEARERASDGILTDITQGGAAGVRPVVRMMVSAPSLGALLAARTEVETTVTGDLELLQWDWLDRYQVGAVFTVLPLGRGIA